MTAEAKHIGSGKLFIGGQRIGEIDSFKAPALPMPPTPGDLVDFVLAKDLELRFTIEAGVVAILDSIVKRLRLDYARRTMSKRGFRRWRAKHWRKARP